MDARKILVFFASMVLLLTLVGGYFYFSYGKTTAFQNEHEKIRDHIAIQKASLSTHVESQQKIAALLAGLTSIESFFETKNSSTLAAVNLDLDYFQKTLNVEVCYLMDHLGNTFASSNRNTPTSFVGKNYGFRPYFKQAIQGHPSVYGALGVTSGKRGLYYGHPIYLSNSVTAVGVAVVKSSVDFMKHDVINKNMEDISLIIDPNGVVFVANDQDWLYKLVWKIPDNDLDAIDQSYQFGSGLIKWSGMIRQDEMNATDAQGNNYYVHQEEFKILPGWKIVYFHNLQTLSKMVYGRLFKSIVIALSIWISFAGIILSLYKYASHDLRKRKEAEDTLRISEERHRNLYKNTPAMLQSIDKNQNLVAVSNTWLERLGYQEDEALGRKFTDFLTEESRHYASEQVIPEFFQKGYVKDISYNFVKKNGTVLDILLSAIIEKDAEGNILRSLAVLIDVTEKKKIEKQLLQTKKLEAIGTMVGGIAHDFNNLLTIIQGNIYLAEEDAAAGSPQVTALNAAMRAAQRAATLTEKFITFSSGGSPVKITVNPQEFLNDTVNIALSGSNIQCDFSMDQDLGMVEIDQGQMNQAIGHIITNAKEAMPQGGTILLTAHNINDEQMAYETRLNLQGDLFVKITVEDHGKGIPKKVLDKIFDPYFSSKKRSSQKGMGLGLMIANSIIHRHGGHIQVASEEGKGTTVSIYLPVLPQNEAVVCQSTDKVADSPPRAREKKTTKILIMDDEKMISNMAKGLLGRLGYDQVEVAPHGEDALKMYTQARDHGEPFDLLFLDLTIKGGMGGEETIKRLYEINPEVRAIACSGYSNDPVVANYAAFGFIGVLAKPFSREELNNAITQALDKK